MFKPKFFWLALICLILMTIMATIAGISFFHKMTVREEAPDLSQSTELLLEPFVPNSAMPIVTAKFQESPDEATLEKPVKENGEYVLITTPILRARTEPTTESDNIAWRLRKGMLLKAIKVKETPEEIWYGFKIAWLGCNRYPERFPSPETWWYFAGKYDNEELAKTIEMKKPFSVLPETKPEDKWIKILLSQQKLEAYENQKKVFSAVISTGVDSSPTPPGTFRILKKKINACMQGPLTEFGFTDKYDLPGIGWTMFFTARGAALHGTYWHNNFGRPHSHGCINLKNQDAEWLFQWAEIGTLVIVK